MRAKLSPISDALQPYRGRLAPSPTGLLHLGHARTFWLAYTRARGAGGTLILRNEDLDPDRARPEFASAMVEDLHWLGIEWQEGPGSTADPDRAGEDAAAGLDGPCGPYAQSRRLALYADALQQLLHAGFLYPCTCSRRELRGAAGARAATQAETSPAAAEPTEVTEAYDQEEDDEPLYSGRCRPPSEVRIADSTADPAAAAADVPVGVTWRFRVPVDEQISFNDGNFGRRTYIAGRDFGDFPVRRRDGVPAYQLACVVDDAAMRITEVVRGADLLKSTARQLLLYRALGLTPPAFFHCPLLRDAAGRRLAKRADSVSIRALREQGLTPREVLALAGVAADVAEDSAQALGTLETALQAVDRPPEQA